MADETGTSDRWIEEMKVTFDSEELASFFDGFEPLEIGEDGFPCEAVAAAD